MPFSRAHRHRAVHVSVGNSKAASISGWLHPCFLSLRETASSILNQAVPKLSLAFTGDLLWNKVWRCSFPGDSWSPAQQECPPVPASPQGSSYCAIPCSVLLPTYLRSAAGHCCSPTCIAQGVSLPTHLHCAAGRCGSPTCIVQWGIPAHPPA